MRYMNERGSAARPDETDLRQFDEMNDLLEKINFKFAAVLVAMAGLATLKESHYSEAQITGKEKMIKDDISIIERYIEQLRKKAEKYKFSSIANTGKYRGKIRVCQNQLNEITNHVNNIWTFGRAARGKDPYSFLTNREIVLSGILTYIISARFYAKKINEKISALNESIVEHNIEKTLPPEIKPLKLLVCGIVVPRAMKQDIERIINTTIRNDLVEK